MRYNWNILVLLAIIAICLFSPIKTLADSNNRGNGSSNNGGNGFNISSSGNSSNSSCDGRVPQNAPAAGSFMSKDYSYRDLLLTGGEYQGTRARVPISHKVTRRFSPLAMLNPWYFVNIQGVSRPGPYIGPVYRGNQNEYRQRNRMTQILPLDTVNTCQKLIEPKTGNIDPYDPVWARMELDACTNQYILSRATYSRVGFEAQGEIPYVKQMKEGLCQQLRLIPVKNDEQEYLPSDYILYAWKKLLYKEDYLLRNGRADKEPNYKEHGIKISDQIPPPTLGQLYNDPKTGNQTAPSNYNFGLSCINDLTETQVERIFDPSHPFSPRWDFEFNERDKYSPLTAEYSRDPINYVRCSGGKTTNIIKVDILSWRAAYFHKLILMRIITNIICYNIIIYNERVCWEDLWSCDDNTKGGQTAGQCCATNYDGEDAPDMEDAARVVCGKPLIEELCESISKALVPINTLKMRKKEDFYDEAIPEGYTFAEYFGNHRPYMRCWDTGLECDLKTNDSRHRNGTLTIQGLKDSTGSKYAILGAGREKENCAIGGGNGISSVTNSGVKFLNVDPITSWTELKLYQTRGIREFGLSCLPKHESVFKTGSGEEIILSRAGAEYQKVVPDRENKLTRPRTFSWPLSWRGYVSDPRPGKRFPYLGSRGSIGTGSISTTGLDDAFPGDILIYDESTVMQNAGSWRNPYIAYVTEENTHNSSGLKWIKVLAFNHGKFIDACGDSDTWGQGEEFTIFKTDVTDEDNEEYKDISYNSILTKVTRAAGGRYIATKNKNCDDPLISSCIEPYWDNITRYFPIDDPRTTR